MFNFPSVLAITIICYLVAEGIKATAIDNKWLPPICGLIGGMIGLVGLNVMPNFPANNPIDAVAVGIVSGLAATGAYEAIKQMRS